MAQIREIKKRMVAVSSIQRITRTMQMIANTKFAAAQRRAQATKPYAERIHRLVGEVAAASGDIDHPLCRRPDTPVGRELLLIISSDRGLCGAFNSNVFRATTHQLRDMKSAGTDAVVDIAGKKAVAYCQFNGIDVRHRCEPGDPPQYDAIERTASQYIEAFTEGEYDAIRVAYMRFESVSRQRPEIMQLLPLTPEITEDAETRTGGALYEFTPSADELLGDLLPSAVKTMLFQAFIDAAVSEQIMRMVAMKAATENAKELGRNLKRTFNRARQSQITTELMEIIAGAAALEG
ncbi:MAG: ATP synthase F1 subunit gamma [Planctomycetota bacterium]|jgi:F-type H+-transporting ATPase subunit gamma